MFHGENLYSKGEPEALSPKAEQELKEARYDELHIFAKVLNLVENYYVDKTKTKELVEGAIKGMLESLDPYTNYLPEKLYKEFQNETTGQYGGLGIEITKKGQYITIISPIDDTPASKAGIKAGDRIYEVNGASAKGISLAECARMMKGKRGDVIKLSIMRESFKTPQMFSIKRGTVKIKSVKTKDLGSGYLFVRISSFMETTHKHLKKELDRYEKKNPLAGMILDLRKNPGGLLNQAVLVSDMFIDKGTIVSTIGRDKDQKETIFAKKNGTRTDFPIVVLIDKYSASASEIVAGALQDHKRATIMGIQSFGKGSVQSIINLKENVGLKMTVARYYTPSGDSIHGVGIKPDVELKDKNPLDNQKITEQAADNSKKPASVFDGVDASKDLNLVGVSKEGKKLLTSDAQIYRALEYLKNSASLNL